MSTKRNYTAVSPNNQDPNHQDGTKGLSKPPRFPNAITIRLINALMAAPGGLTTAEAHNATYDFPVNTQSRNPYYNVIALVCTYNRGLVAYAPPGKIVYKDGRYYHVPPAETIAVVILPTALLRNHTPVLIGIGNHVFEYRVQDGRLVREKAA